ncbi:hypothetical protein [Pseudomonas kitaguniensis]|uniref:hypothetical protein n=1 Tax=Pseudomonas kitaguniensis TaxID=2607908 RepID=UPI003D08E6C5
MAWRRNEKRRRSVYFFDVQNPARLIQTLPEHPLIQLDEDALAARLPVLAEIFGIREENLHPAGLAVDSRKAVTSPEVEVFFSVSLTGADAA